MKFNNTMKSITLALALLTATTSMAAPSVVLKGVDPAFYKQKRNHKPDVSAELKAQPLSVSLAILKDPRPFLVEAGQSKEQRDVEVMALRQGALAGLVAHAHDNEVDAAVAAGALVGVLQSDDLDDALRALAAERLGEAKAKDAVDVLSGVVGDAHEDVVVRAGAAAGLGRVRDAAALDVLVGVVAAYDVADEVRVAGVHAMANLTSRWAWQAKGDAVTGDALRAKAKVALTAVKGSPAVVAARDEALRTMK